MIFNVRELKDKEQLRYLRGDEYLEFQKSILDGDRNKQLESLEVAPYVGVKSNTSPIEKAAIQLEDGEAFALKFTISTSKRDRDRDTINVNGWDLESFRKNPIVLFGHDHGTPPIARSPDVEVKGRRLVGIARFPDKEINPFGFMIGNMAAHKFLNMSSVGFKPKSFEINEQERGIDYIEQELWEYSIVPIGSNPDAFIEARSVGIDVDPAKEWAEKILDQFGTEDSEHTLELLEKATVESIHKILAPTSAQVPEDLEPKGALDDDELEIVEPAEEKEPAILHAPELYERKGDQVVLRDASKLDFSEAIDAMETLCGGNKDFNVPEDARKEIYEALVLRYARERILAPAYRHVEAQSLKHFGDKFFINSEGQIEEEGKTASADKESPEPQNKGGDDEAGLLDVDFDAGQVIRDSFREMQGRLD